MVRGRNFLVHFQNMPPPGLTVIRPSEHELRFTVSPILLIMSLMLWTLTVTRCLHESCSEQHCTLSKHCCNNSAAVQNVAVRIDSALTYSCSITVTLLKTFNYVLLRVISDSCIYIMACTNIYNVCATPPRVCIMRMVPLFAKAYSAN